MHIVYWTNQENVRKNYQEVEKKINALFRADVIKQ